MCISYYVAYETYYRSFKNIKKTLRWYGVSFDTERICRTTGTIPPGRHCSVFKLIKNEDYYFLPFHSLMSYWVMLEKSSLHLKRCVWKISNLPSSNIRRVSEFTGEMLRPILNAQEHASGHSQDFHTRRFQSTRSCFVP